MSMAGGGSIKGSDLRYCWVNLLSSNIPVLVLAVDDALLTSAERVFQNLRMSGASMSPYTHTECHLLLSMCAEML